MNTKKDVDFLLEQFIADEKSVEHNPFLSTRIMIALENRKIAKAKQLSPVWRTAIVTFGFAVAVFIGFATGNLYNTGEKKADVILVNDDAMEHFAFYGEMENE